MLAKSDKEMLISVVVLALVFLGIVLYESRNDPPRWYGPSDFKGSMICIDKVNPQMRGFTFNDSVSVGTFYKDYHTRKVGDESSYLDYNIEIGDCLLYTNHPLDSVYHIDGHSGDTTLYLNLFPKEE